MRVLRKMFEAVTASLFAVGLVLFLTLFCAAACTFCSIKNIPSGKYSVGDIV